MSILPSWYTWLVFFFPNAFQIRNHSFPKYVEVNKMRAYRVILAHCSYELLQLPFTTIHFSKEIYPTYPWNIARRTQQFMKEFLSFMGWGMPLVMLPRWQLLTCAIGSGEASALTFRGAFSGGNRGRGGRSVLGEVSSDAITPNGCIASILVCIFTKKGIEQVNIYVL